MKLNNSGWWGVGFCCCCYWIFLNTELKKGSKKQYERYHLKDLVGYRTVAEESYHALYTLVSSFLIVILRSLNGVKESIPVIWDSLKCIVNPKKKEKTTHTKQTNPNLLRVLVCEFSKEAFKKNLTRKLVTSNLTHHIYNNLSTLGNI